MKKTNKKGEGFFLRPFIYQKIRNHACSGCFCFGHSYSVCFYSGRFCSDCSYSGCCFDCCIDFYYPLKITPLSQK